MEKRFGLLFFQRKRRNLTNGEAPVYMKITVDGESVEISTKRKCTPEKWDSRTARMTGKSETARDFNAYLDLFQQYLRLKRN
jgi:hypothetical protein